ncbi:MAG: hypothetical protein KatS3mg057_2671 [Herpetosiphonaceae bacterium]|nr:MAG: hypothetical protein KatS3mg057_2671 [Herpetosiphonaceae bacterium]
MTVRKLLPMLCLLLVACDISTQPAPTPSPSAGADPHCQASSRLCRPAPLHVAYPCSIYNPFSCGASTVYAPQTMLATYFFYWYDCPPRSLRSRNGGRWCQPGWNKPLPEGGFISTQKSHLV